MGATCWQIQGRRGGDRGASLLSRGDSVPHCHSGQPRASTARPDVGEHSRATDVGRPPEPPLAAGCLLQKPFPPKAPSGAVGWLCPRSRQAPRSWQPKGAAGGAGGEGRGPVPLRGVAVTRRALFFAGEWDRLPEREIQAEGPTGRRGLPQTTPTHPSRWSGEWTESSTMGEYRARVTGAWGAVAGGSGDPVTEQSLQKLPPGISRVPVATVMTAMVMGAAGVQQGRWFLSQSVFLSQRAYGAVCGERCYPQSWSHLRPPHMGCRDESSCLGLVGTAGSRQGAETCHNSCHF